MAGEASSEPLSSGPNRALDCVEKMNRAKYQGANLGLIDTSMVARAFEYSLWR